MPHSIPKKVVAAAAASIRAGATYSEEVHKLSTISGANWRLRVALRELLGAEYDTLMQKRAPFGGRRASGDAPLVDDSKVLRVSSAAVSFLVMPKVFAWLQKRAPEVVKRLKELHDAVTERGRTERAQLLTEQESIKRVMQHAAHAAKHRSWTAGHVHGASGAVLRLTAADGRTYIRAGSTQRADVILEIPNTAPAMFIRMRLESEASATRKLHKEQRLVERGNAARAAKKKGFGNFLLDDAHAPSKRKPTRKSKRSALVKTNKARRTKKTS
jgi:hypothetical protein